jgi:hypothetical protein
MTVSLTVINKCFYLLRSVASGEVDSYNRRTSGSEAPPLASHNLMHPQMTTATRTTQNNNRRASSPTGELSRTQATVGVASPARRRDAYRSWASLLTRTSMRDARRRAATMGGRACLFRGRIWLVRVIVIRGGREWGERKRARLRGGGRRARRILCGGLRALCVCRSSVAILRLGRNGAQLAEHADAARECTTGNCKGRDGAGAGTPRRWSANRIRYCTLAQTETRWRGKRAQERCAYTHLRSLAEGHCIRNPQRLERFVGEENPEPVQY